VFGLLGIARHSRSKRDEWLQRGYRYADAPVAIFILLMLK
jgi:hypothetical protein